MGGKEYNILSREIDGYTFPYSEFYSEEQNGDTVLNGDDMFGLTCNAFCWQPLFAGTDSLIIEKDKDDKPYLAWGSERNMAVMGKIIGLLNDRSSTILVKSVSGARGRGRMGQRVDKDVHRGQGAFLDRDNLRRLAAQGHGHRLRTAPDAEVLRKQEPLYRSSCSFYAFLYRDISSS